MKNQMNNGPEFTSQWLFWVSDHDYVKIKDLLDCAMQILSSKEEQTNMNTFAVKTILHKIADVFDMDLEDSAR